MRSFLITVAVLVTATVAIAATGSGCGSSITVPDQGVIVLGCHSPSLCYKDNCSCDRGAAVSGGSCTVGCNESSDQYTCVCPASVSDNGAEVNVQCLETSQACTGRGPTCDGPGVYCAADCSSGSGDPPQSIPVPVFGTQDDGGSEPILELHCQFTHDVCCHGTIITDAGASD
jgi:hypothetical protein